MHSGELLMSRYAIIAFVYVVMCINKKYKKIKEYELMSSSANS
jgi:hypothetical protein